MLLSLRVHCRPRLSPQRFINHLKLINFFRTGDNSFQLPSSFGVAQVFPLYQVQSVNFQVEVQPFHVLEIDFLIIVAQESCCLFLVLSQPFVRELSRVQQLQFLLCIWNLCLFLVHIDVFYIKFLHVQELSWFLFDWIFSFVLFARWFVTIALLTLIILVLLFRLVIFSLSFGSLTFILFRLFLVFFFRVYFFFLFDLVFFFHLLLRQNYFILSLFDLLDLLNLLFFFLIHFLFLYEIVSILIVLVNMIFDIFIRKHLVFLVLHFLIDLKRFNSFLVIDFKVLIGSSDIFSWD